VDGDEVTQGLTDFGQKIAHEIVFVESPRTGRTITQGETFMSMESGKWVGRIAALLSGEITAANDELEWEPTLVNESPFENGWLVKIKMSDPSELDKLMKAGSKELKAFIEGEAEKYKEALG
jgi:glycine cleavage system H protein